MFSTLMVGKLMLMSVMSSAPSGTSAILRRAALILSP